MINNSWLNLLPEVLSAFNFRKQTGPDVDDPQMAAEQPAVEEIEGQLLRLHYTDTSGFDSERTVQLILVSVAPSGDVYMRAHCFMRDEPRTFRADRISLLASERTGEVFEDPESWLLQFAEPRSFEQIFSPEFMAEMAAPIADIAAQPVPLMADYEITAILKKESRPFFVLLMALARSDALITIEEQHALTEITFREIDRLRLERSQTAADRFAGMMAAIDPTRRMVKQAAGRLKESAQRATLAQYLEIMAHSDGRIVREEVEAIRALVTNLGGTSITGEGDSTDEPAEKG